jgi:hypothetical protein
MIGVLLTNLLYQSLIHVYLLSSYFGYRKLFQYSPVGATDLDTRLGLYIQLCNLESLSLNRKVYAKYKLRINKGQHQ